MPVRSRFKKISRYVTGKDGNPRPVLPQALVLNARAEDSKKLRFTSAGENGVGTLEIPEGVKLWEVDGQHRLGGLRYAVGENAEFGDFPIPIVITEGLPRLDEAVLFGSQRTRKPSRRLRNVIGMEQVDQGGQFVEPSQLFHHTA